MSGREELRVAAEAATPGEMYYGGRVAHAFIAAADPPTVLALLDELDAAEARLAAVRRHLASYARGERGAIATLASVEAAVGDSGAEVAPEATDDAAGPQIGGNG